MRIVVIVILSIRQSAKNFCIVKPPSIYNRLAPLEDRRLNKSLGASEEQETVLTKYGGI